MLFYRIAGEFIGKGANKRLSAHTIATFMALQGATSPSQLSIDAPMEGHHIRKLLRQRAVNWWLNPSQTERPGEPAWMRSQDGSFLLTREGLNKVHRRVNGEERTKDGKRSSYNVDFAQVVQALDIILQGAASRHADRVEYETIT